MKRTEAYTDEQLLLSIAQDDERAFIELYNRYAGKMRALAFSKVNSKDIAAEIVQTIFANLWERRHTLNIITFSNYLSVAVKYQVINHIKSEISHKKHKELYKAFIRISSEETLEQVKFADLSRALESGVLKLPEKTQIVFRLNRLEGKSVPDIAVKLNLSEKAIKYHISRSLKELRLHLKDYLTYLKVVYLLFTLW